MRFVWQPALAVGESCAVESGCGLRGVKFVAITIKIDRDDGGKV